MLVKELRQGLRTKGFLTAFLVIQGILALSVLAAQDSNSSGNGSFFWILGLALVTVLPLRGLAAFSTEESRENLDLVRLTKLSTWRIVLGKWAALSAQSALFITTILPYVVLRYFVGGVNPLLDLAWVLTLFLLGTAFTSIAIALSTIRLPIPRLAGAAALIISSLFVLGFLFGEYYSNADLPGGSVLIWLLFLVIITGGLVFALLTSAVSLSSAAENYATPRRILALGMLSIIAAGSWLIGGDTSAHLAASSIGFTIISFVAAFGESQRPKGNSFQPLTPGYFSSISFGVICAILSATAIFPSTDLKADPSPFIILIFGGSMIASLLAPAALSLVTEKFFGNRVSGYICISALTGLLLLAFVAFAEALSVSDTSPVFALVGSMLPPFITIVSGANEYHQPTIYLVATLLHLTIVGLFFALTLRRKRDA